MGEELRAQHSVVFHQRRHDRRVNAMATQNLHWMTGSPIFDRACAPGLPVSNWQNVILVNMLGKRFYDGDKANSRSILQLHRSLRVQGSYRRMGHARSCTILAHRYELRRDPGPLLRRRGAVGFSQHGLARATCLRLYSGEERRSGIANSRMSCPVFPGKNYGRSIP